MAETRFTTGRLEVMCYAEKDIILRLHPLAEPKPHPQTLDDQIRIARTLMERYRDGYDDVVPNRDQTKKYRKTLIALLKLKILMLNLRILANKKKKRATSSEQKSDQQADIRSPRTSEGSRPLVYKDKKDAKDEANAELQKINSKIDALRNETKRLRNEAKNLQTAETRFTTRELEILCDAGGVNVRNLRALDYQIKMVRILMERHRDGFKDVIPDRHQAEKYRQKLIVLLGLKATTPIIASELARLRTECHNYRRSRSYSGLRTANFYSFWDRFHLFRFVTLGLFLLTVCFSALPLDLGGFMPSLGKALTTYDYAVHMVLGGASTFYLFEVLAHGFFMIKGAATFENGTFSEGLKVAHNKLKRKGQFRNALVWFLANGAGFLLTGGWWDSTSFSGGWSLPTWNSTIYAHWIAAGICMLAAIHDRFHERSKARERWLDRTALANTNSDNPDQENWLAERHDHLQKEIREINVENPKGVNVANQFILGLTLFFAFAKVPWGEMTSIATTSGYLFAPLLPWAGPLLGMAGSAIFLYTAWTLLRENIWGNAPVSAATTPSPYPPPTTGGDNHFTPFTQQRNKKYNTNTMIFLGLVALHQSAENDGANNGNTEVKSDQQPLNGVVSNGDGHGNHSAPPKTSHAQQTSNGLNGFAHQSNGHGQGNHSTPSEQKAPNGPSGSTHPSKIHGTMTRSGSANGANKNHSGEQHPSSQPRARSLSAGATATTPAS